MTSKWARLRLKPHVDCLLNPLFRRRSKKTSKLRVTGFCEGEFTADRKMFPFDDVIMRMGHPYPSLNAYLSSYLSSYWSVIAKYHWLIIFIEWNNSSGNTPSWNDKLIKRTNTLDICGATYFRTLGEMSSHPALLLFKHLIIVSNSWASVGKRYNAWSSLSMKSDALQSCGGIVLVQH